VTPLGLDLSVRSTGWAVWGVGRFAGRVRTDLTAHAGWSDIRRRTHIADRIGEMGVDIWPFLAVIEAPFAGPNRKTGEALAMLHAVVLDRLGDTTPVAYVTTTTLKKHLAGRGDADKQQMVTAAQQVGYPGAQNDEADAWGLALIGHHLLGGGDHLTPMRAACLAAVTWETPMVAS